MGYRYGYGYGHAWRPDRRVTTSAAVGGAGLLVDEANGFATDFLYPTDAQRVAIKETLGPEIITNSGFDSDTYWLKDADWTIAGGVATKVAGAATRSLFAPLSGVVIIGRTYKLTYTLTIAGSGNLQIYLGGAVGTNRSTAGTFSDTITVVSTAGPAFAAPSAWAGTIDNVSVKEVVSVGTTTTTNYALDGFYQNAGTSPKQVWDVNGVLGWSPHNMCLQSQTFDNASWDKATTAAVTPDAIAAPNGTLTADKITELAVSNNHLARANVSITTISGATYTFSVYAKQAERSFLALLDSSLGAPITYFNLATGAVGSVGAGYTAAITDAGSGWYRCSITYIAAATAIPYVHIKVSDAQGTYLGVVGNGIYVWGAQLNRGSTPLPYLPTTTAARYGLAIDYDPVTHASKGLLCEPAATNLQKGTATLTDAAIWLLTGATGTAGGTAPDGRSAFVLTEDTANSTHSIGAVNGQGAVVVSGTVYTVSGFVKAKGRTRFRFYNFTFNNHAVYFDLTTGTTYSPSGGTAPSSRITAVGNDWYRIEVTDQATSTQFRPSLELVSTGTTVSYAGDGVSGVYVWLYGQVETGTVATSPIPTFAATATRGADGYFVLTSAFPLSATASTMIADFTCTGIDTAGASCAATLSDGDMTDALQFRLTAVAVEGSARVANVAVASCTFATPGVGSHKAAFAAQLNDFQAARNGVLSAADTSGAMPVGISRLDLGNSANSTTQSLKGYLRKITYVPRRMSDAELQAKTT